MSTLPRYTIRLSRAWLRRHALRRARPEQVARPRPEDLRPLLRVGGLPRRQHAGDELLPRCEERGDLLRAGRRPEPLCAVLPRRRGRGLRTRHRRWWLLQSRPARPSAPSRSRGIRLLILCGCVQGTPLLVGLLSQIIEPRSCINNGISYTFALSRGRSVRPRLHHPTCYRIV